VDRRGLITSRKQGSAAGEVAVAVDIGGTKIAAGCVDREGHLLHRVSTPTVQDSAQGLLDAVVALAKEECRRLIGRPVGVGVSMAGSVDPASGDVRYAPNIPAWRDVPLGRALREAIELPVVVGFDGHLAALGEHWVGAGRGTKNMVLLAVGTGIGGGLILDGKLYGGSDNLAGAAGWMIVDPATIESEYSRSKGNLESISSGPALADAALRFVGHDRDSRHPTAEDALDAAQVGDEDARRAVERAATFLAYGVADIVSLLNPEVVILGGGLGSTGVFLRVVREHVSIFAQPTSGRRVRIEAALLGADAGLIGAARAVFEHVGSIGAVYAPTDYGRGQLEANSVARRKEVDARES
jgi:glucokinase